VYTRKTRLFVFNDLTAAMGLERGASCAFASAVSLTVPQQRLSLTIGRKTNIQMLSPIF
jgi:hypothetical protein